MSDRSSRAHPLLRPFPLAVMALATILLLFVLAMARLNASGSALRAAPKGTAVAAVRAPER
jgi:hypothetical protein